MMIPLMLTIALQSQPTPREVLGRLVALLKTAKTLRAEYTLSSPIVKGNGTAVLTYDRPNALCYTMKWAQIDYRFVGNTTHGFWDADYGSKHYDSGDEWQFYYPTSRGVSRAPDIFEPGFLVDGTLRCFPVSGPKYIGRASIKGVQTDQIESKGLNLVVDLYVARDGKPVRCTLTHGKSVIQADLTALSLNGHVDRSLFASNPPLGFHEWTVPFPAYPISVSEKFPVTGWHQRGDATRGSAKCFVMVTAPDCEPSAKAAPLLRDLVSKRSFPIILTSLAKDGSVPRSLDAYPVWFDPTGKLVNTINAPGTPLFYLLNADGTVIKVWYGFDPDHSEDFEKDILDTAAGKGTD